MANGQATSSIQCFDLFQQILTGFTWQSHLVFDVLIWLNNLLGLHVTAPRHGSFIFPLVSFIQDPFSFFIGRQIEATLDLSKFSLVYLLFY